MTYSNYDKYGTILIEISFHQKGIFIMSLNILRTHTPASDSPNRQWKSYILLLSVLLCTLFLSCFYIILQAGSTQKKLICENMKLYVSAMDSQLSESDPNAIPEASSLKKFFIEDAVFPDIASRGTLAILHEDRVLTTEGHNILSYRLVAEIARTTASDFSIHTYREAGLPGFYFCVVNSKINGMVYCYYEPILTGWPLLVNSLTICQGIFLTILILAWAVIFSLLIATFPKRPPEERIVEITVPDEPEEEAVFGSLPYFSGIIIDYHNTGINPVSPEILKLFDQIISDNLSVNKILYRFSSQRNSDCLQYDMNYVNYNLRVLSDSLKMNLFNAAPDYEINIYYSNAVATYEEMEKELLYLHRNLRYSLILGYGKRLSIEQIRLFEASSSVLDTNVASTIQNHLKTRAYEDLYTYLRRYRDILARYQRSNSTHYSFAQVYRFAEESFSVVKLFFQENNFEHPMVQSSCITILRGNPGFHSFCEYLISCIRTYQCENQHVLSSRNEQIMNSIYMYIEQDLAGANLNSIARKMQMTDSHLSRVFKKNTGSNFSEYLTERKMEEAARLLIQEPKMKVAEISDLLGYGNPTYFLSRFKTKFGISPSAYRKEHLEDNSAEAGQ